MVATAIVIARNTYFAKKEYVLTAQEQVFTEIFALMIVNVAEDYHA